MRDKRIVVIGGGSGIGEGIARSAIAAGAEVIIVGRTQAKLQRVAGSLGSDAPISVEAADVTDESQVIRLFKQTGPFDYLVSTVADLAYQPIREFDVATARRAIDSKLISSLLLAKHGCGAMRPGGSIALISGIAAYRPRPGGAMVAAVNGALESMVYALALELAPLRVNAVSPGWVDTPVWDVVAGDNKHAVQAQMAERLPVGHIGTPAHIAQAVLSLLANEFITGTVQHVDGGHRLV